MIVIRPSTWRSEITRDLVHVPGEKGVWDSQGAQYLEEMASGIARGPVP